MKDSRCPAWLLRWLLGSDQGMSSRALAARLSGLSAIRVDSHMWAAPSDADDFGRCLRLLDLAEKHGAGWRARVPEMAGVSPGWARLTPRWSRIETAYRTGGGVLRAMFGEFGS